MKIETSKWDSCWMVVAGLLWDPAFEAGAREEKGKNPPDEFVIPLEGEKSAAVNMRTQMAEDLEETKLEPKAMETKDGRYVIYGDLFQDGGLFRAVSAAFQIRSRCGGRAADDGAGGEGEGEVGIARCVELSCHVE